MTIDIGDTYPPPPESESRAIVTGEWERRMLTDLEGFRQYALRSAGVTPDGRSDTQYIDALWNLSRRHHAVWTVPAGELVTLDPAVDLGPGNLSLVVLLRSGADLRVLRDSGGSRISLNLSVICSGPDRGAVRFFNAGSQEQVVFVEPSTSRPSGGRIRPGRLQALIDNISEPRILYRGNVEGFRL